MSVNKYQKVSDANVSVGDGVSTVGIQEGMPRRDVNNAMRSMCADIAKYAEDNNYLLTGGSADSLTVTTASEYVGYSEKMSLWLNFHVAPNEGSSINVNNLGEKPLLTVNAGITGAVATNEVGLGSFHKVTYNGTGFVVVGAVTDAELIFPDRDADAAALIAAAPNGSIGYMNGEAYLSDDSFALNDSCTADLGQAGIVPFGPHYLAHYGQNEADAVFDATKVARYRAQSVAQGVNYMRKLSSVIGGTLNLADTGAQEGAGKADVGPFLAQALQDVMGRDTGGTVLIPDGRWFCDTQIPLQRGTNIQSMQIKGESERAILDFRSMSNVGCLRYDGAGTDGPTYMQFTNFAIRGDTAQTLTGIDADFLSSSILSGLVFEKLSHAINTEESFGLGVYNSRFNNIVQNAIRFNSNAHSFRMSGCRGNDIAKGGGAVFNFNTDANDAETHSVWIAGNNFDQVGGLVRTGASSGGITGLSWLGNYSEGFLNGTPFFDFSNDGVRGFECVGGSFSVAGQSETPDVQVIDYVDGGRFDNNRINGLTFEQGENTKGFDWGPSNNVIGGGGAIPDGFRNGLAHDATPSTNEFLLTSPWAPQASYQAPRYRKTQTGEVILDGFIDYGGTVAANALAFQLPAGFRPPSNMVFATSSTTGAASVQVNSNGSITVRTATGSKVGLSGIRFKI